MRSKPTRPTFLTYKDLRARLKMIKDLKAKDYTAARSIYNGLCRDFLIHLTHLPSLDKKELGKLQAKAKELTKLYIP